MTVAYATLGSVTEIRFRRSVVLINSDLSTMTRRGADPWGWADCGGRVVVCVPVGTEDWSRAASLDGGCAWASDKAGRLRLRKSRQNIAPRNVVWNFILKFSLIGGARCVLILRGKG